MHLSEYWSGAVIPKDVEDSFRKLLQIATENNVSFQDLCVYALGNAQAENKLGTFPTDLQVALLVKNPAEAKEVLLKASANQTAPEKVIAQLVQQNSFDEAVLKSLKKANFEPQADVRHLLLEMASLMLRDSDAANAFLIADTLLEKGLPSGVLPATVLSLKGQALLQLDRWEEAERAFLQSTSLAPLDTSILNILGYEWTQRDVNLTWARELLERAHRLAEDNSYIRDSLGWNYVKLGMIDEAIPHLEAAINGTPTMADPYAHIGEAYRRIGDAGKAEAYWRRALQLEPQEPLAR